MPACRLSLIVVCPRRLGGRPLTQVIGTQSNMAACRHADSWLRCQQTSVLAVVVVQGLAHMAPHLTRLLAAVPPCHLYIVNADPTVTLRCREPLPWPWW